MALARLDEQFTWDRQALQPELRKFTQAVESRLKPLDDKLVSYDAVIDEIAATGLARVNEVLIPAVQSVIDLTDLGFMTAPSTYSVTLALGTKTWVINAGAQRTNFRPTPWVYIQHDEVLGDWGVGQLIAYDHVSGVLELSIQFVAVGANPGPHVHWTLSMSPAATPALLEYLPTGVDLTAKYADVLVKWAATVSAASAAAASAVLAATFDPAVYYTKVAADARYYTQTALDVALAGKAPTSHTHTASQITDFNTAADARVALAPSFAIGDVSSTMRNPGSNWLVCDGAVQTTATYVALQALLGNKFATFDVPTSPSPSINTIWNIIWEPSLSLFAAAGAGAASAGALSTSPDGTTWTSRDTTASRSWRVSSRGSVMMIASAAAIAGETKTSSNGTVWTAATSIAFSTDLLAALTYVGTTFIAIGITSQCKTSANDGTSWTSRTIPYSGDTPHDTSNPNRIVASSGSIVVLLSSVDGVWYTTTDGTTWTRRTGGAWNKGISGQIIQVRYVNGTFVISGTIMLGLAKFFTSTDGINWTERTIPASIGVAAVGSTGIGMSTVLLGYVNPVYAFMQAELASNKSVNGIIYTTDFISFRRTNFVWSANSMVTVLASENSTTLLYTTNFGASIQRTVFDYNTSTQFKLPDLSDGAIPRWIKAL